MTMLIIGLIIGGVVFGPLGYWLAAHIHAVAAAAASGLTRAVTIPAGVTGAITSVSPLAAGALAQQTDALKAHITDTVNAAVAALPKSGE